MKRRLATIDGNEAAARVAHVTNEVIAIYPITPASGIGELCDTWSAAGRRNLWGVVPSVIEMQSEGGAAGAVHGSLQGGALTTTFTASQGLLLMIPNMYKIAGELTPTVFHVAARTVATHALSIFGDHSDVMATRQTGWAMLCASSVQEIQDFALISQASTLATRIPFLHFFDGFRSSHEVNRIVLLEESEIREMLNDDLIRAHRARSLDPERPVLRGTAQNPDVFFQSREAINPFYRDAPGVTREVMARFGELTGRQYGLFDYVGAPDAERVLVLMGSGCGAAEEAVEALVGAGERVGMVKVRLYRPFDTAAFLAALPATARSLVVLDRTKEPGAVGEPLYQDVVAAVAESWPEAHPDAAIPRVLGGRFGLSSKEFTPAMAKAALDEGAKSAPKRHFTVGIRDDVTHLSLPWDPEFRTEPEGVTRALFFGLGSDGTVGANKNSVKIIGENTDLHAQGYFVYDSKKSGAVTVSHLRFSPEPIRSTYLVDEAQFVACHQFHLLHQMDVLEKARQGGTFLLNSPYDADSVWELLPREVQEAIRSKELRFYVIDAARVATDAGLGKRINTVMQTCFFGLTDILPLDKALPLIKEAIEKTYGKRGETVVRRNLEAVDASLASLQEVTVADRPADGDARPPRIPEHAPEFIQRVTGMIMNGKGDLLPVSAMPIDGTFPTDSARWEKRGIASEIPIWDEDLCISCALCSMVCPHAAIRTKVFAGEALGDREYPSIPWKGKEYANGADRLSIQVAPDDCTGCGVCVEICPAKSKSEVRHKAINMEPRADHVERERDKYDLFLDLPEADRSRVNVDSVKGSQLLQPLFESSGACAGCGETPYLKLLTQLFGDRILVANATGCSSIFGGNLPTTPWSMNAAGHGPAWSNSLFEDNAEFGLGMRLALDGIQARARSDLEALAPKLGDALAKEILEASLDDEASLASQRERVDLLRARLADMDDERARSLLAVSHALNARGVWIVGGDGWAYDIGFGGVDHVLASGRNINVLVLDTEVYSNTGGQASKATFRGATAKFAASGKPTPKKDLGMIAMAYGNAYVAQIALGAKPKQAVNAFIEAERHPGPSLIIAYSPCIAHGIDMRNSLEHEGLAVETGYWPLYRFRPGEAHDGGHPFRLDSNKPRKPFREMAQREARFAMLMKSQPERARHLIELAQKDIDARWAFYHDMAGLERTVADSQGGPRDDR